MGGDDTTVDFESVLRSEHASINQRRTNLGRPPIYVDPSDDHRVYDTVGLALSGGGIRSAAISLGVLQALNHFNVLRNVDYLSTVSGGGFVGSSLTATMSVSEGKFVFGNQPKIGVEGRRSLDSPAVQHLRNFSNYLMPAERKNIGLVIAIVVRGLVANAAIVLPFLLMSAGLTIWSFPTRSSLLTGVSGGSFGRYLPSESFGLTIALVLIGLLIFFLWALYLSFLSVRRLSEDGTVLPVMAAVYLFIVVAAFFLELQPLLIAGKFDLNDPITSRVGELSWIYAALITVATFAAAVGVIAAAFRNKIGPALRRADATSNLFVSALGNISKGVVWIAALSLPLWMWIAYLQLAYWGILNDASVEPSSHIPIWVVRPGIWVNNTFFDGKSAVPPVALLYIALAPLLLILSGFLKSNALSLHGLYRDRLRKAFLFDPTLTQTPTANAEFGSLDRFYVSEISPKHAPYHLINAALNIRGSRYANQRGRDADFFVLSPNFTGSRVTGYAPTKLFEHAGGGVDLATAMAISAAALSSSMGAQSIRVLRPTLALLNVRVGYWLPNPRRLQPDLRWTRRVARVLGRSSALLLSEITGRLYTEWRDEVYVTDGAHIESLGLYELLRRRCRIIVCVDAEADPQIRCNSLIALQRYASIDLGVRIEMPWGAIQSTTRRWMGHDPLWDPESKMPASNGPHAAVGVIEYEGGEVGYLLYFKASLTGDENDFVQDYARRYSRFPHEGTGNQFFNEEQFEVYRALGFHMVYGVLSGKDNLVMPDQVGEVRFSATDGPVRVLRDALLP